LFILFLLNFVLVSIQNTKATDMSSQVESPLLEEAYFKVGRYSAEERKEKISRYRAKRSRRKFNKIIKVKKTVVFVCLILILTCIWLLD